MLPGSRGLGCFSITLYPLCLAPVSSEHVCCTNECMDDPSANRAVMLLPRTGGSPAPSRMELRRLIGGMECDRSLWYPGYQRGWECKLGPEAAFLKFHLGPGGACREVNLTLKFLPLFFTPSQKNQDKRCSHAEHSF